MLTSILRIIETRSLKPLEFTSKNAMYIDEDVDEVGLYVHIPFCKILCPFCPYNKVTYHEELAHQYNQALIKEIEIVGSKYAGKKVTSIYFGGGTPALMVNELESILDKIKDIFDIKCDIGIELHPRDVTVELLQQLKSIGFTMISLGIQSFQRRNLSVLGRELINGEEILKMVSTIGFNVIDVDFIFGIKGQTEEDLKKDINIAFLNGATQVSTYPFIDFSYANNLSNPLGRKDKKKLLEALEDTADGLGLKRTSVWTFGERNVPKYSSITRDSYIGFGPSAATLTKKYFKINTFSVEEYIRVINERENPKALTMDFTPRVRALYWLFWNCYTLELNSNNFKKLFGVELDEMFGIELKIAKLLGLITKIDSNYKLTKRGSYIYHLLEQHYTHQYIDKTWNTCTKEPWPQKIKLY